MSDGGGAREVSGVLGVDVGGVIIQRTGDADDDTFFTDDFLSAPMVEGAFDTLRELAHGRFAGRVYIVSKCGEWVEDKTRRWLAHHRFEERTGIPDAHLHFTRTRQGKEPICDRLDVTHFVDDRLDVLGLLTTVPHRLLFLGGGGDRPDDVPDWAVACDSWADVAGHLSTTR